MKIKVNFFNEDLIKANGAGIYEIDITYNGRTAPLYIGESVYVLVRCASLLYNLENVDGYMGFNKDQLNDPDIALTFSLLKQVDDSVIRKKEEKEYIKIRKPISQSGKSDYQKDHMDKALENFLCTYSSDQVM